MKKIKHFHNYNTVQKDNLVSMLQLQGYRWITATENTEGLWDIEADFWGLG